MIPSTLSLLMVFMLAGCSKSMPCSNLETSRAAVSAVESVNCKDESKQVNIHLAGKTIISDCFAVVDAMDKLFASTEPIPACHHCPLPQPKPDRHRKGKPKDVIRRYTCDGCNWSSGPNDSCMAAICGLRRYGDPGWYVYDEKQHTWVSESVAPPKIGKHRRHKKRPTCSGCGTVTGDGEGERYAKWLIPTPASTEPKPMTPQQFTDFMDDNFPSDPNPPYKMELCGGPDGCRPLTAEEINRLMRQQPYADPPSYPPNYKMPKGSQ